MPFESEFDVVVSFDGLQRNHFNNAGTFHWQAVYSGYSGDANNNGAASVCASRTPRPIHLLGNAGLTPTLNVAGTGTNSTTNTPFLGPPTTARGGGR